MTIYEIGLTDVQEGAIMRYYEIPRHEIDYFREEYEFLSNFYPTKVLFEGILYYNSEAAYQAQKRLRQADKEQFAALLQTATFRGQQGRISRPVKAILSGRL